VYKNKGGDKNRQTSKERGWRGTGRKTRGLVKEREAWSELRAGERLYVLPGRWYGREVVDVGI